MADTLREVMTSNPATLATSAMVRDAARAMAEKDIGNVIVMQDDTVYGILTDRDITVRAVAEGRDPDTTSVGDICTMNPETLGPDDSVDEAVRLMRERAVRRIPVVENGRPVGVVSLGDLAVERDPGSALSDISAAPPD